MLIYIFKMQIVWTIVRDIKETDVLIIKIEFTGGDNREILIYGPITDYYYNNNNYYYI